MGIGDLTWLSELGQGSPVVLAIGVLVLVWRREAKKNDRLEQSLWTALRAVEQVVDNTTTLIHTTQRLADAVDGWGTTAGRHRRGGLDD